MADQYRRAWNPADDQNAGAMTIQVPKGTREMTGNDYHFHLANRVEKMIRRERSPAAALETLMYRLETAGLLDARPPENDLESLFQITQEVVAENQQLRVRLSQMGLPTQEGMLTPTFSAQAAKALRETSLEAWLDQIT
jgi:hypothetical protein